MKKIINKFYIIIILLVLALGAVIINYEFIQKESKKTILTYEGIVSGQSEELLSTIVQLTEKNWIPIYLKVIGEIDEEIEEEINNIWKIQVIDQYSYRLIITTNGIITNLFVYGKEEITDHLLAYKWMESFNY